MKIIKALPVGDSVLVSSNVPEDDLPLWVSNQAYSIGDKVKWGRESFTAVNDTTGKPLPPPIDPSVWLNEGLMNRYRMFDNILSNPTTNNGDIVVKLKPNSTITSLVLLEIICAEVTVTMTDPSLGVVYQKTEYTTGGSNITSFYDYHTAPVGESKRFLSFLDLPDYPASEIEVVISNFGTYVEVGELLIGFARDIGRCNYGTSIGLRSFSRKETNEFGITTVVKRRNSKYAEYDIDIETKNLASIQRFMADIDSVPCVYIGKESMEELIVYGFYSDFQATIAFPQITKCTLRVEGLI